MHLGIVEQVEIPFRVLFGPTVGCYDDIAVAILSIDQGEATRLARTGKLYYFVNSKAGGNQNFKLVPLQFVPTF